MKRSLIMIIGIMCFSLPYASGVNYDNQIEEYHHKIVTKEQDLKNVEQELLEIQNLRDQYVADEQNLRKNLKTTDRELSVIRNKIINLSEKLNVLKKQKNLIEDGINAASILREYWQSHVDQDLINYYVDYLISRNQDTADRVRLLYRKVLIAEKHAMIIKADREYAQAIALAQRIDNEKNSLANAIYERVSEKTELLSQKDKQEEEYRQIKNKSLQSERELSKLEESARMLKLLVQELQEKKEESEYAKTMAAVDGREMNKAKGNLPWPLIGEIVSPFGKIKHPTLGTYICNNGVEIRYRHDPVVHAVAKGSVVFAGSFGSFENMVIIDHNAGFFTIYGRLETITVKKGQSVKSFDELGTVKEREGKLYFEIRKKEQPEDPTVWLKGR